MVTPKNALSSIDADLMVKVQQYDSRKWMNISLVYAANIVMK